MILCNYVQHGKDSCNLCSREPERHINMKSHRIIVSVKDVSTTALDQLKKYEEYIHTTKREVKIGGIHFLS